MAKRPSTNTLVLMGSITLPVKKTADGRMIFQVAQQAGDGFVTCVAAGEYLANCLKNVTTNSAVTVTGRFKPVKEKDDDGTYKTKMFLNVENIYDCGGTATVLGRLTSDARLTGKGQIFGTIAVDDGLDKAGKETASFIDVCFGKREKLFPYLKKGKMLCVSGAFHIHQDGYFFAANTIVFVGGNGQKKSEGGNNGNASYQGDPFSSALDVDPLGMSTDMDMKLDIASDDLPF